MKRALSCLCSKALQTKGFLGLQSLRAKVQRATTNNGKSRFIRPLSHSIEADFAFLLSVNWSIEFSCRGINSLATETRSPPAWTQGENLTDLVSEGSVANHVGASLVAPIYDLATPVCDWARAARLRARNLFLRQLHRLYFAAD